MTPPRGKGHQARKRFGQHFLTDAGVIDAIVRAIAPRPGDNMVEIGPGLAAMTQPLVERLGRLTVVELDRDLAMRLRQHPQLQVVEGDVRHRPFSEAGFIDDLASCRGVIAGGGFSCLMRSDGGDVLGDHASQRFGQDRRLEILERRTSEGVDVILNPLSGPLLDRSLSLLRSGGRFVDLTKRDHLQGGALSLSPFLRGLSYFMVDLHGLLLRMCNGVAPILGALSLGSEYAGNHGGAGCGGGSPRQPGAYPGGNGGLGGGGGPSRGNARAGHGGFGGGDQVRACEGAEPEVHDAGREAGLGDRRAHQCHSVPSCCCRFTGR